MTQTVSNVLLFVKIACITIKAKKGDATAQNCLGDHYYHGRKVERSYKRAVKWIRKAAKQGDATGQFNLGVCYYNGQGVERSYKTAVKWYRKAAKQGDTKA